MSTQIEQTPTSLPEQPEPAKTTDEVLLEVQGLNKSFGGLSAVSDLNLQVKRGQIYSIIGPNGAGKTTVFNVITGIYRPNQVSASFLRNAWGYVAMLLVNTLLGVVGRFLIGVALGAVVGYFLALLVTLGINQATSNGLDTGSDALLGAVVGVLVAGAIAIYLLPRWRRLRGLLWGTIIAVGIAVVVGFLIFSALAAALGQVVAVLVFLVVAAVVYNLWLRFMMPIIQPLLVNAENILRPYEGKVLLRGQELVGLSPDQVLRQGVARTFQNIRLFNNMTVLENVMVGGHARMKSGLFSSIVRLPQMVTEEAQAQEKALQLLRFFGEDLVERKDDPASSLSYAEKRRVEIARALASDPQLLLLDEPTAGMNEAETVEATRYIRRLRDERGMTILLIEHKLTVTMGISDWIAVLDYGRKIAEGLPADIRRNELVIEAYLGRKATVHNA
ncbi:MAG TPA: ATP-binding cassette domain-containing protein [Ktedonobacterales bacterium]|nr:ATP-binding cassette domain-containing protein [Ktedonobacterales bacterium]